MQQWAPISAADALELLSPDFRAEVVREHAVVALQVGGVGVGMGGVAY